MERDSRTAAATAVKAARDGESASQRIGDECRLDADDSYVSFFDDFNVGQGVGGWVLVVEVVVVGGGSGKSRQGTNVIEGTDLQKTKRLCRATKSCMQRRQRTPIINAPDYALRPMAQGARQ
jgi:hypothetical protein